MKKLKLLTLFIAALFIFTGCNIFKMDTMEGIDIITTNYSLEFITKSLYGKHAIINSIYPDGTDTKNYTINDKMLDNYSKEDLFIYASYGDDKDIAVSLLNRNKKLLIIDGSLGMSPDYLEELWLDPSNLLMVAQNIKNGLTEYINSNYLVKEVEANYDDLKLKLSELDVEIKLTAENATSKTIVSATKSLNYLKKYGFDVISLDDDNTSIEKSLKEVNDMIKNSSIKYIYTLENTTDNDTVKSILENNSSVEEIKLKRLDSITTDERNANEDYFFLMNYNIEQLKKETYK